MSIVGARIDGRLVHGQVANLWIPSLKVDRVIVIDEEAVNNKIEKSGLRMATPMTTRLSVLTAQTAANHLNNSRYGKQRVFLVCKKPQGFLDLIKQGVKLDSINVGTMSQTDTTKAVTKQIYVEDSDISVFKDIEKKGVELTAQLTPASEQHEFITLLNKVM